MDEDDKIKRDQWDFLKLMLQFVGVIAVFIWVYNRITSDSFKRASELDTFFSKETLDLLQEIVAVDENPLTRIIYILLQMCITPLLITWFVYFVFATILERVYGDPAIPRKDNKKPPN